MYKFAFQLFRLLLVGRIHEKLSLLLKVPDVFKGKKIKGSHGMSFLQYSKQFEQGKRVFTVQIYCMVCVGIWTVHDMTPIH